MAVRATQEDVLEAISNRDYAAAQAELKEWNEADIAALLEDMSKVDSLKVFRLLPKDMAADVFSFLPIQKQQEMIASLTDEETDQIIENMYADDAADLLEEMPSNVVKRILSAASPQTRDSINQLLRYPKDSAGAIMTVEYVTLRETYTVVQALEKIRRSENKNEDVNDYYVLNSTRELMGSVTLQEMVFHELDSELKEIMEDNPISVYADDNQESVAQAFQKYNVNVMPVVDSESRMVGIITADDIMDVIEEEATEDMTKMAAVTPDTKPYSQTTVLDEIKRRIPWLLLLMLSATFTGAIITAFENKLAASLVLAAFMPMLMDTGGNAGGQASTMVIRALSLNEIQFRDFFRVVWKEFRVALCCGIILAIVNFAKMMLIDRTTVMVGFVVCLTMIVTVICAKLIGSILPILARRVGLDPAVMANPVITTIVDAVSLFVYFEFATWMLNL
ncbi:MAG: magnesium transporter [Oscillospiraceae bacterium]|nr:magnesium transporter [Oscillospiraceae bacterium]